MGDFLGQVRVDAVVALRSLVEAYDEEAIETVKPRVPALLNDLFQLMNEVVHLCLGFRT